MTISTGETFQAAAEAEQQTAAAFLEEHGLQELGSVELTDHDGQPMSLLTALDVCQPIRGQIESSLALAKEYAPEDITGFLRKALNARATQAAPDVEAAKKKDS